MKPGFTILAIWIFLLAAPAAVAQTDVIIAVDLSRSMRRNDQNGNRFIGADQFLSMFSLYGNNRGGVVSFGNSTSVTIPLQPLSFDQATKYKAVLDRLPDEQWTELGLGLKTSKAVLGQSDRKKSIILISDGIVEGNPDKRGGGDVNQAKIEARAEMWGEVIPGLTTAEISVYTIGLFDATDEGEPTLQKIAADTGGFYTRIRRPEEFSQVYKKMLDDIGQPAGVSELTNEKNSIFLTPADEGVIVFGPTRFTVKAPNNLTYTTNRETPNTPVKQKFVEYDNNTGILYLGRPENSAENQQFWNGRWQVEGLSGPGEATYISNIRLKQSSSLPIRRTFFLNEFYTLEFNFEVQPNFDADALLSKCRIEYLLVPQGNSKARPLSGALTRNGNTFSGEQLLEHDGDYYLQVRVFYQDFERNPPPIRISVNQTQLMEMTSPQEQGTKGDGFRIQVKENLNAFKNDSVVKGLSQDSVMTFSLRYGPDLPISIEKVKLDPSGFFKSEDLRYAKTGDLQVEGLLEGKLIAQKTVENGDPIISHYKVKARTFRTINVGETYFWSVVWPIGSWTVFIIGVLASLVQLYAHFFLRPKQARLDAAALTGTHTILLEPDKKSWTRFLWPGAPSISIGGPESKADITDATFTNAGPEPVMEIAVGWDGQYRIARKGRLDVSVNNTPLTADQEVTLSPMDKINVNNMQFTFDA